MKSFLSAALFAFLFQQAKPSTPSQITPIQVCLFQSPALTIGTCPAAVAGPAGPQGPTGATGPQGPQGIAGTSNLTGVALSTLPANSLAILLNDGTAVAVQVINQPIPTPAVAANVNLVNPDGTAAGSIYTYAYYASGPAAIWQQLQTIP